MSSILVVEHEGRYIERIQDALSSEGWQPRFVAGRPEALRAAASEEPGLVLVNAELPGAAELLRTFARRHGGPGAVALLAEHDNGSDAAILGADEVLGKPFTDQELRLVVRRGLARARGPQQTPAQRAANAAPAAGEEAAGATSEATDGAAAAGSLEAEGSKLSSADIFGDLLAEVEAEVGGTPQPAAEPAVRVASRPATPAVAPPAPAAPGAAATPAPPAAPAAKHSVHSDDPEIARRLEQTLSGVLDDRRPRAKPSTPPAPEPKRRRPRTDAEVDELLNLTLSNLGSGESARRPPRRPKPAADENLFADLDLSEIEALADTRRRPRSDEVRREPAAAAPVPVDEDPGDASWADVAQAVEHSAVEPAAVEPPPALEAPAEAAPADDRYDVEDDGSGERFGHYTLLERIAIGGMAEVWKARMRGVEGFQKTVAIKKILPQMTDNSDFVTMFIDEAKLAAQLNHPNITHIYDLGKIGRDYYIAMEYVDGSNLRTTLNQARRKGMPVPVKMALLIAARLASALDYAHRKRDFDGRELELVHRDVSPQNVLLSFEGDIKLCDFGIVKAVTKASHTQMGALKGKLQYMSPEQAWGQAVDARSDIFSLGALLFEMLTGERLFSGDSEISVLELVRECYVRSPRELNPEVGEYAEEVVMRALAKEPENRFQTAGDMQQELERILYRMSPTPSQAELGSFLRSLTDADELSDEEQDAFSWAGAAAQAPPAAASDGAREEPPSVVPPPPPPAADVRPAFGPGSGADLAADDFAAAVTQPVPIFESPPDLPDLEMKEDAAADAGGEPPADGVSALPPAAVAPPPPGEATGTGHGTDAAAPAARVAALEAPNAAVEIEEGGAGGRLLLVAAIVLIVLAGIVGWYLWFGPGAAPAPASVPVPLTEPAANETPAAGAEGGVQAAPQGATEDGTTPADDAGSASTGTASTGSPDAGSAAAQPESAAQAGGEEAAADDAGALDMQRLRSMVNEELARREAEIRRDKEEELRRLEAQLEEVRAQSEEAPAEGDQAPAQAPREGNPDGDG